MCCSFDCDELLTSNRCGARCAMNGISKLISNGHGNSSGIAGDACDNTLLGSVSDVCNNRREAVLQVPEWVLRPVLLAGRDGEQRGFGGRRDLDCSAPRVRWLRTPLRGKAKAQGTRPRKPEKKGTHPIGNSRGIAV